MTEPMLSVALDGAVTDIGIGPESLWTWYMDSMEGPGGRTPRRRSAGRLYRGLRAATHICSESPERAQEGTLSRRRRTYIRVYPLPLQSPIPEVSACSDGADARCVRS